jgi:hypothetical protein
VSGGPRKSRGVSIIRIPYARRTAPPSLTTIEANLRVWLPPARGERVVTSPAGFPLLTVVHCWDHLVRN